MEPSHFIALSHLRLFKALSKTMILDGRNAF